MLEHLYAKPSSPERVVVLGAGGFVGTATAHRLSSDGINNLPLARSDIDLLSGNAAENLAASLFGSDALVVISARAPCKDVTMLGDNIRMIEKICAALQNSPVAHVVYISSDAVYRDSPDPLTEDSCAEPGSLHGVMHLAREIMLKSVVSCPIAILRPSLLYGAEDPHNGYGPNQFRHSALAGEPIKLFGEGEERRDHVLIDDVAELVYRVLMHRSEGILNVATGTVASFREVSELVLSHLDTPPETVTLPRSGPMPHNGYRPFDPAASHNAFPDFNYTPLAVGIEKAHREALETQKTSG